MDIQLVLNILTLIISVVIIALVLIQQQESGFYSDTANVNRSRRGTEKLVFNLTIVFGTLFVVISLANLFL